MRNEEFSGLFTGQIERLDMFFHRKLMKAGLLAGIEEAKKDLIQDTAEQVLKKLSFGRYETYEMKALIWMKAKDACYHHIKTVKDKTIPTTSLEMLPDEKAGEDPIFAQERSDLIQAVFSNVDKDSRRIFLLHAQGFKYREIALQMEKSENAIKTKISRIRVDIAGKWSHER